MLTSLLSTMVILLLVGWTAATALNQTPRTRRWISWLTTYDIFGLIPIWTFFAPNPGNTDVHLLYRDRAEDGSTSAWRDVPLEKRQSAFEFWSPRRRIGKGVVDIVPDLTANTRREPRAPVDKKRVLGFPYLLLLNYVCHQPLDFRAEMRQFAIARTHGRETEGEPDVIFLSAFHRLK